MVDTDKVHSERIVRIWDDPLARIRYLETVLADKEWEAVIYQPEFDVNGEYVTDAPAVLKELQEKLNGRDYSAVLGTDENGIPVLKVKNFGAEMNATKALEELGMVKGVAYSFTHMNQSFGKTLRGVTDHLKTVARDKARFIGGVYLLGDALLALAGKFEGKQTEGEVPLNVEESKTKQALFTAAGIGATLQSLVFLVFAKDQGVERHNSLEDRMQNMAENGKLLDERSWRFKTEEITKPSGPTAFLKRYPIQLGALSQVLGQVGLIASAVIGLKQHQPLLNGNKASVKELFQGLGKKSDINGRGEVQSAAIGKISGAWMDVFTGILSSASWMLITKTSPNKYEKEELASWANPTRWWQEVMQAPNKLASVLAFGATTTGMAAGWAKGNKMQAAANVTYLAGDGALFLLDNESYGEGKGVGSDKVAEALVKSAQQILTELPVVLGKEEQAKLVDNVSHYVAAKVLHEQCSSERDRQPDEQKIEALAAQVRSGLHEALPEKHQGLEKLAGAIATLSGRFGDKEADMRHALCGKISSLPAVHVSAEELAGEVAKQPVEQAKTDIPQNAPMMKEELAGLLATIPCGAQASMANAIYDVVSQHTPVSKEERMEMADYVVDKAFNEVVAEMAKAEGKTTAKTDEEKTHLSRQINRDAERSKGAVGIGSPS